MESHHNEKSRNLKKAIVAFPPSNKIGLHIHFNDRRFVIIDPPEKLQQNFLYTLCMKTLLSANTFVE